MRDFVGEQSIMAGVDMHVAQTFAVDFGPAKLAEAGTIFAEPVMNRAATGEINVPVAPSIYAMAGKRVLDLFLVLISLPLTLPLIGFCALALWLEGGNPFYQQKRLGKGRTLFSMLKLRTMVPNAEQRLEEFLAADPALRAEWDSTQKLKNDPRITRLGAFLRKTSIDELPQIWNVFTGEMSIVGPRPMMPEQLPLYGRASAYFALRPGLTGPWQVSDRNESRFDYRAVLDAAYGRRLSLISDVAIIFRTVGVVLKGTGY